MLSAAKIIKKEKRNEARRVAYERLMLKLSCSRRAAAGRAELLANFFGGAVWGNFRENANCGDPPG